MPFMTSHYWNEHKDLTPIRQLRSVYRFLYRHSSLARVRHRLSLEWAFLIHRSELRRRLEQAGVRAMQRQVIVISQVVHLGDIVACEPVVRKVRREMPKSFIVLALHRNYRALADANAEIDHVLPVSCVTEWARFAGSGLFDRIIDLNIDGRVCEICGVPWHKPGGNRGITVESYYSSGSLLKAYCESAGLDAPTDGPRIETPPDDIATVNRQILPERFVVLHADSIEKERELPVTVWRQIIFYINNHWRLPVIEIGLKTIVLSPNDPANRSLCGQLSILQSAEVIRRCVLFLGIDSGPAHLATATGAFGIIALGHYHNFQRYMPYSGDYANGVRCELLYHDGPVSELPVTRIIEAIDRRLSAVMGSRLNRSSSADS
jgi:ADP-heptose:LPS heptosyltransferase